MSVSAQAHAAAQGTLVDWPIPRLLQEVLRRQVTGCLIITDRSHDQSQVFLREGTPVHVDRPVDTDRLDRVLIELGALPADVVAQASAQVAPGKRLGQILLDMGVLDQEMLGNALRVVLRRKLMRLFSVHDGNFEINLQPHDFGRASELAMMRVDPRLLFYPAIRSSYDLARLNQELTRLAGAEFKLVDLSQAALQSMTVSASDPTIMALRSGWLTLDALDGLAVRPLEARALILALFYADLLERRQPSARGDALFEGARTGAGPAPHSDPFGSPRTGAGLAPVASADAASAAQKPVAEATRAAIEDLHARLGSLTLFDLLKISETASPNEVSSAFVRGARQFHPDRLAGVGLADLVPKAEQIVARMSEASLILQDPARRAEYVASLRTGHQPGTDNVPGLLGAETTFLKGEVFLKKGDYPRAVECFTAAIKGNPNEPQYKAYLAWARFDDPRTRKETVVRDVQRTIQEVVQQHPRFARGHFWLGQLWKFLNEPGRAEQAFAEAVNLERDFIEAGRELRLLQMRRRKGTPVGKSDDKGSGLMNRLFKK